MDVLVGVCGTEDSFEALESVLTRARDTGDEVTVAVVDDPTTDSSVSKIRDRVRSIVAESGMSIEIRDIDDPPEAKLVEIAEAGGYDQLVIGSGSRSPMGKIRLDDTAQFVLFNAKVTVTLVR